MKVCTREARLLSIPVRHAQQGLLPCTLHHTVFVQHALRTPTKLHYTVFVRHTQVHNDGTRIPRKAACTRATNTASTNAYHTLTAIRGYDRGHAGAVVFYGCGATLAADVQAIWPSTRRHQGLRRVTTA